MVFLCHDVNDVIMEAAKMAKYADHKTLPTAIFGVFFVSWILTRIVYFPLFVIRSVWSEPIDVRSLSHANHALVLVSKSGMSLPRPMLPMMCQICVPPLTA